MHRAPRLVALATATLLAGGLAACSDSADADEAGSGDSITIETESPERLAAAIRERFALEAAVIESTVRLEAPGGHDWIPKLVEAFSADVRSITLGKPTLEDVFIDRTGHRFFGEGAEKS